MSKHNIISDDDQLPFQSHIVSIKHETSSSSSNYAVQPKWNDDDAAASAFNPTSGRKQEDDEMTKKSFPDDNGRERLKRHRMEMSGRVWIPDIWGQEQLLKDWVDSSSFDASLVPNAIVSARSALVQAGRRATSGGITI